MVTLLCMILYIIIVTVYEISMSNEFNCRFVQGYKLKVGLSLKLAIYASTLIKYHKTERH